jgi:hypothetical protein
LSVFGDVQGRATVALAFDDFAYGMGERPVGVDREKGWAMGVEILESADELADSQSAGQGDLLGT